MSHDPDQTLSYVEELARAVLEDRVHLIAKPQKTFGPGPDVMFVQIVVDPNRPGVEQ